MGQIANRIPLFQPVPSPGVRADFARASSIHGLRGPTSRTVPYRPHGVMRGLGQMQATPVLTPDQLAALGIVDCTNPANVNNPQCIPSFTPQALNTIIGGAGLNPVAAAVPTWVWFAGAGLVLLVIVGAGRRR